MPTENPKPDAENAGERLERHVEEAIDQPQDIDGFVLITSFSDGAMASSAQGETRKTGYALVTAAQAYAERMRSWIRSDVDRGQQPEPPEGRIGFQ